MTSLRKPKRIVAHGHDERDYPFLVKGGEDLRQDQRVQQLLQVMNGVLARDAACSQRGLQLETYRVVPMTSRCRSRAESPTPLPGGGGGHQPELAGWCLSPVRHVLVETVRERRPCVHNRPPLADWG